MAPKKASTADDLMSSINTGDQELEQAIDDLRGVLQKDTDSSKLAGGFGGDFSADAPSDPLSAFGGDFGAGSITPPALPADGFGASIGGDFAATTDFGDGGFGSTEAPRPGSAMTSNLDLIMDIPIDVQIVLGSSQMQVSGLMNLTEGATIALDRRIGEPVEVMVNGRVIGRGEITVLENDDTRFGVKLIEIKNTRKI
ncbi:MAG: flagellar motor switch protein FliN [Shinella sp.]|jgi:flagellar motor switch protein FliN|nr:flagellar motor switch protein FliN [Shinella sp.]